MFALRFYFLAGRYHATPWGRNVNEGDVAWPPEPWRLLRSLIAVYWCKGDRERWPETVLGRLIDALSETPPVYRLPGGSIHAHARHYMSQGRDNPKLVFDAFARIPEGGDLVAAWPDVALDAELFALVSDLASAIGYLGRAESWTECKALADWSEEPNCGPLEAGFSGHAMWLLASLSPMEYVGERERLIATERGRISSSAKNSLSESRLEDQVVRAFKSKQSGRNTLPPRLVDAISLDTADWKDCGWPRPPAARELLYAFDDTAKIGVLSRASSRPSSVRSDFIAPTVARFLLAGRPLPRVEDTIKIGELIRLAAISQFGWQQDGVSGRRTPRAPWQVSGRDSGGEPLREPFHRHAFWLPEDADSDGLIDHISVFVPGGLDKNIRAKLDKITRLWVEPKQRVEDDNAESAVAMEWRLALEGFGQPADFASDQGIFGLSRRWRSVTPFMAAGHLKAAGHAGEFRRLVRRTGMDRQLGFEAAKMEIRELPEIKVAGAPRRVLQFHRFRSRGRNVQRDRSGAFLEVVFPVPVDGPLALGYGSHFGLGLFAAVDQDQPGARPPVRTLPNSTSS